ncbi:MAG: hypothetical protein DWQ37_14290 [Planctomycetota bacterium]|nr:MAG: hypothetical protein DWQ37_14290 [Planctomycetota bacterium]
MRPDTRHNTPLERDSRGSPGRRLPKRPALVLVLVLIVVMMIALAGFSFAELMLTENKAAHLHGDALQLQQALASGVEQLKVFLEQPRALQDTAGGSYDNPKLFRARSLRGNDRGGRATSTAPSREPRFSVVVPVAGRQEEVAVRYGVENESGRLHLADLLRIDAQQPGAGGYALMQLPGMTTPVADAILDWIDPDSQPRAQGAESEYYAGLDRPYAVRNGLPESLEELLLVKGVTHELLFGADRNYNRFLEREERERSSHAARALRPAGGDEPIPWSWLLTVYSGQRNTNSKGTPRIDLNGPNLAELQGQLSAVAGPELATFVVAYRQYGPHAGGGSPASGAPPVDASAPPQFRINTLLDLVGAMVAVPTEGSDQPKVYNSPLSPQPAALREQFKVLEDATTTVPHPVIRGLVSVNHAPACVLRSVPGIDEALAEQIVSARQSTSDDGLRRSPTWLWFEGMVDLHRMKQLMPFVSAGGDVVRAQVVAHVDGSPTAARAEVVVDATRKPAHVAQWRDLRFHGAGFPLEMFAAGASHTARN